MLKRGEVMKYDLHIHTKYSSDGVLEPVRIAEIAIKRDFAGIAITDHNTIRGAVEVKRYETDEFQVVVGAEIMTDRGEITGLFLNQEVKPGNLTRVVHDIKNQGGLVIIPHPFDDMRHSALHPTAEDAEYIDAIEVYNSRCILQKYNRSALEFARKHGLPVVAGSDAHFANEIGNAGIITYESDIRKAIVTGKIEIFGKRALLLNHAITKGLKSWRKVIKSG